MALSPDERADLRAIALRSELCAIKEAVREQTLSHWSECAAPPEPLQKAAWAVLAMCARELGVALPLLRWFAPETEAKAAYAKRHGHRDWPGFSTDIAVRGAWQKGTRTVWVASGLPLNRTLATVAHEVAHAAGGDEDEATNYERRWAASLPSDN